MCGRPIAVAALLVCSVLGPGQATEAGEFRVNTGTTSGAAPAVAMDAFGGFVAVWMAGTSIVGRRYDADGAPLGAEFPVSSPGNAFRPHVASDFDGNFVVAWTRVNGDSDGSDAVFARRHDSNGNPRGSEFRVNTATIGQQADPRVASDGGGGFVVVWQGQDGSFTGVFGQRFSASGNRINDEFRVNTATTNHQSSPDVASDGVGNFMVVWASSRVAPGAQIVGRAYAASAGAFGPEFVVSTNATRFLGNPVVSTDIFATQFVVAWSATDATNEDSEVVSRRLDAAGNPQGAAFQVNTYTTGYQREPAIAAALASGGFVVAWSSDGQDGSGEGIFAQMYDGQGNRTRPELQANTYTTQRQMGPAAAAFAQDRFVLAWQSEHDLGTGFDIYALRYGDVIFGDGFDPAVP